MNIVLENVSKKFNNLQVLNDINLKVSAGEVFCLLGKNGAGKSTIINIIANLIEPDFGTVSINGLNYMDSNLEIKKMVGLQSQFDQLIEELNAFDYLNFIGLIYHVDPKILGERISELLNFFFDEKNSLKKKISSFSIGMKKKLMIAAALIHKPNILLLDEPFANLDPLYAGKLCKLLEMYKNPERLVFISSHDIHHVDKIATNVGLLDNTKLVLNEDVNQLITEGNSLGNILNKFFPQFDNIEDEIKSIIA